MILLFLMMEVWWITLSVWKLHLKLEVKLDIHLILPNLMNLLHYILVLYIFLHWLVQQSELNLFKKIIFQDFLKQGIIHLILILIYQLFILFLITITFLMKIMEFMHLEMITTTTTHILVLIFGKIGRGRCIYLCM